MMMILMPLKGDAVMSPAVLIVSLSKRFGGAEVRVLQTASGLHGKCRYAVAVLKDSPLHRKLIEAGASVLPVSYGRGDPRLFFALIRMIKANGFTVVDAHNPQSQFWGFMAASFCRVPVMISTVHSSYGLTEKGLKKVLYETTLRLNRLLGCRFIAVSEAVTDYLRTLTIPSGRITLIHNAIHVPLEPADAKSSGLKESLGWRRDDFLVGVVGSIEPVKGHKFLIKALGKAIAFHPELRCLFVGEGRLREDMESLVRENKIDKHVKFLGFRNDVMDILRGCDAFCMPSLSEGLPFALLEACSLGLPVLVSSVGGMALLIENGKTGMLVPPSDPEALTQGLCSLAGDHETSGAMGQAARAMVKEKFSPDRMLAQTLSCYGLIKQNGR